VRGERTRISFCAGIDLLASGVSKGLGTIALWSQMLIFLDVMRTQELTTYCFFLGGQRNFEMGFRGTEKGTWAKVRDSKARGRSGEPRANRTCLRLFFGNGGCVHEPSEGSGKAKRANRNIWGAKSIQRICRHHLEWGGFRSGYRRETTPPHPTRAKNLCDPGRGRKHKHPGVKKRPGPQRRGRHIAFPPRPKEQNGERASIRHRESKAPS